jgi:hypothetical protein
MTNLITDIKHLKSFTEFINWYKTSVPDMPIERFLQVNDFRLQVGVFQSFISEYDIFILFDPTFYTIYQLNKVGYERLTILEDVKEEHKSVESIAEIAITRAFEYLDKPF